jgi:hypothetical protein
MNRTAFCRRGVRVSQAAARFNTVRSGHGSLAVKTVKAHGSERATVQHGSTRAGRAESYRVLSDIRSVRNREGQMHLPATRFPTENHAASIGHKLRRCADPSSESRTMDWADEVKSSIVLRNGKRARRTRRASRGCCRCAISSDRMLQERGSVDRPTRTIHLDLWWRGHRVAWKGAMHSALLASSASARAKRATDSADSPYVATSWSHSSTRLGRATVYWLVNYPRLKARAYGSTEVD